MKLEFIQVFYAPEPFIGIAPGRLDVMGGIADYSGSLLLQMPIAEETRVSLMPSTDGVFTASTDAIVQHQQFSISLDQLKGLTLQETGEQIKKIPGGDWAVYILGCFTVLEQAIGLQWKGATVFVESSVPAGKGVSSSAAIEVATMHAIQRAYGLSIPPLQLAILSQQVENQVVGAACGLMDQLSVNFGKKDHLLPLVCQPCSVFDPIPIPHGIRFIGLDSGVRHAVSGASYGDVRTAAFMGFVMAMKEVGIDPVQSPYQGYLANIPLDVFLTRFLHLIPEQISGKAFLDRYQDHLDTATAVVQDRMYHTRAAALHPVQENHRIKKFLAILKNGDDPKEAGRLMLESHAGYQSVGLGEAVTDRIVELVRTRGLDHGIAGARISGGGSGGTVAMMLTSEEGYTVMQGIRQHLESEIGKSLKVFEGSSNGAHLRG
jgi:L-arabinokinase